MSATPGVPVLWSMGDGGNGNQYEVVIAGPGGISWEDARLAAEARGGYLATITSQAENDFVYSLIDDAQFWHELNVLGVAAHGPWIGAFKAPEDGSLPAAQGWQWVTGETFSFANWASGEPNRTTERYVHFGARGQLMDDVWNNWINHSASMPVVSYIVEYDAPAPEPEPPVNLAPAFLTDLPGSATQTIAFSHQIAASDPDGDALTFTAAHLPAWLTLTDHGDGTATLSGTPGLEDLGAHEIVITVSDGEHTLVQASFVNVESIGDITGQLYHDKNRNGKRDSREAALAGWTVYLDANSNGRFDVGEKATLSGADGAYHLGGVLPGEHDVRVAAPIDMSVLDDYKVRHIKGRHRVTAALSDTDHFRQTWVDDRTLLLEFEVGDDGAFDEMAMEVQFGEDGCVTLDLLSKDRGSFHLVQKLGRFEVMRPLGHGIFGMRDGMLVKLGWRATTDSTCQVTTQPRQTATDADFGLTEMRSLFHYFFHRCH